MSSKPPIGTAAMEADGTIVMMLRAEGPDGTVGDATDMVRPTDRSYAEVLAHLGGLTPGESKPVLPWD